MKVRVPVIWPVVGFMLRPGGSPLGAVKVRVSPSGSLAMGVIVGIVAPSEKERLGIALIVGGWFVSVTVQVKVLVSSRPLGSVAVMSTL